jgi:carbon starvation protein
MPLGIIALVVFALFLLAYRWYGRWLGRTLELDDQRVTPAHEHRDGGDFEPTPRFPLLAQHFSAISAAGPIVGPIVATLSFGWVPGLLWIVFGCIFIGAAHDFATLQASVRHGARSVAVLMREQVGKPAYLLFVTFIWLALLLVIINFTDVTARAFVRGSLDVGGESLVPGPAVASSSMLYLGLAVALGVAVTKARVAMKWAAPIAVALLFLLIGVGQALPLRLPMAFEDPASLKAWYAIILAYCFLASVTPLPYLLQPRGFLGGLLLYTFLGVGAIGLLFGGHSTQAPAFVEASPGSPLIFPFLFVTIACGACSGFHGLVCSGTTSKQIDRESHTRPVGYGAMLLEGVVAVIALSTVAMLAKDAIPRTAAGRADPNLVFALGIAEFGSTLGLPKGLGLQFGLLALATFIYDTLDVCTRLGRYLLQELAQSALKLRCPPLVATLVTLAIPAIILVGGIDYEQAWRIFGASNQLLAALSLLAVAVWRRSLKKSSAFAWIPAVFVLGLTLWALVVNATNTQNSDLLRILSWVLLGIGSLVAGLAIRKFFSLPVRE